MCGIIPLIPLRVHDVLLNEAQKNVSPYKLGQGYQFKANRWAGYAGLNRADNKFVIGC
jgi:hypothetical protein